MFSNWILDVTFYEYVKFCIIKHDQFWCLIKIETCFGDIGNNQSCVVTYTIFMVVIIVFLHFSTTLYYT